MSSAERPLLVLTNDDGITARGIRILEEAMQAIGDVVVVAPDRERSAIGHAISLYTALRMKRIGEHRYAIDGTPTDCVYMALNHVLPELYDGRRASAVVSGINRGPNLGDDVTYSGTVAGAFEATILGAPGIAVSLVDVCDEGYLAAGRFAETLVRRVLEEGLPPGVLLNANIPYKDAAPEAVKVTRLGKRHYGNLVHERKDPRGYRYYWIGGERVDSDPVPDSDTVAVDDNVISLTPLHLDMTEYAMIRRVRGWQLGDYPQLETGAGDPDRPHREEIPGGRPD